MSFIVLASLAVGVEAADEERWIVSYRVADLTSKQLVLEMDFEEESYIQNTQIFAGEEYNITIVLDIGLTAAYAELELQVDLLHADTIDRFWEIHTTELDLTEDYNPNTPTITFHQVKGKYAISVYGRVPSDLTLTDLGQRLVLHKPVNHTFIKLRGPDRSVLDEITLNVIDSEIDSYRLYLDRRKTDLQGFSQNSVDPAFTGLFSSLIALAEQQAEAGFVGTAQEMLESLEVEIAPVQTGPTMFERYFLPAVGGLSLLVILLFFMLFRARGRIAFTSMVVEDQIRELEGLSMRASRTDRNLGAQLQEINEKLKEMEG